VNSKDITRYIPKVKAKGAVVDPGDFVFAAAYLDHGHIYGQVGGLLEAGGICKYVHDPDPYKVKDFTRRFPGVKPITDINVILQDKDIKLVAAAGIPDTRGRAGVNVMEHGKDYFVAKTPFTTLSQLDEARQTSAKTGRKYMVYYSERLHCESAVYAGQLVQDGAIGDVVQITGIGAHRLNASTRPSWFFNREQYGGILCDIGSHQAEQFLYYSGAKDATVLHSKVGNYSNPQYPELEDFGDATMVADNGVSGYFRVDWFTPNGLSGSAGDGRLFILGTKGAIEVRKFVNVGHDNKGDHVFLYNETDEVHIHVSGKVGCPFFGDLILDCINRTENAMTQEHAFKAAELCLLAQEKAMKIC